MVSMDGLNGLNGDLDGQCNNAGPEDKPDMDTMKNAKNILPTLYIMTGGDGLSIRVHSKTVFISITDKDGNAGGIFRVECTGNSFKMITITAINGDEQESDVSETDSPNVVSSKLMEFQSMIKNMKSGGWSYNRLI